jgi:hypothetical protein
MDSIRVSEAPDTGSIPVEATKFLKCIMLIYSKVLSMNSSAKALVMISKKVAGEILR